MIALSRRASWVCAVLVAGYVAWSTEPLTVASLVSRAQHLQFSYADVYSELHEQPFAYCDSFYARRADAMRLVDARVKELSASTPMAVMTIARDYDAMIGAVYEADCSTAWRPYQNSARFQAIFTQDYPLYFAIAVLRLTEIRLALLQIVAGWLGVLAVSLLAVYFWRSPLAPVAALAITSFLVSGVFKGLYAVVIPGVPILTLSQQFLFPAVTILLLILMVRRVHLDARERNWWTIAVLALVYAVHALVYYVIDTPVARIFVLVGAAYVGVIGIAYRRGSVMALAALAAVSVLALDALFKWPGRQIYAAMSLANHLGSEAYTNVMIYMGLFERPSPFGLFYMDEIFAWIIDQDPVLAHVAPFAAVHQSYAYTGSAMVWQAITTEPLTLIGAAFRRVLMQALYAPVWVFWTMRIDWIYTGTLAAICGVTAWAWIRRPLFVVLMPVTLCLLVNQFLVGTVMTLVHTHSRWSLLGVMLMFAVTPVYVFAAVRLLPSTRGLGRRARALRSAFAARPLRLAAIGLVVAAGAGWILRATIATVRQERQFVQTWMNIHQPPDGQVKLGAIVRDLEAMRVETADPHGEIAMWIVSILRMYTGRYPNLPADQRQQVDAWRENYYQTALTSAPDNPHFLFAAQFLQIGRWESYLEEGVRRFPHSPYAPGAAAALYYSGRALDPAMRAWVVRQNEALTGDFLASGRSRIPGFEDVPRVEQTVGPVTSERVSRPHRRATLRVRMGPGAIAFLAFKRTWQSPSIRFVSYLDVTEGDVDSGIALRGASGEPRLVAARPITGASQTAAGRYQTFFATATDGDVWFGLWVRAGSGGGAVELRDYYPIVDYPKHYYRSGLMARAHGHDARRPRQPL